MLWQQGLVLAAVMILLPLALYAGWLLGKLWQQRQAQHHRQQQRNQTLVDSIQTIAQAMQSGQCNLSEGVLRLHPLLEAVNQADTPQLSTHFPAMQALFEAVAAMPTHEARKNYKRNQIMKWDLERELAESRLQTEIEDELPTLLAWCSALPK